MQISEISKEGQKLIKVIKKVNYGRIMNLKIRDGNVLFTADTIWERDVRFDKSEAKTNCVPDKDYEIKKPLADFFRYLSKISDGEISKLEIQAGIPCLMRERRILA